MGAHSVRSGEFTIGGQLGDYLYPTSALHAGHRGKIWWRPDLAKAEMSLEVRGRSLTNPQDTLRFNSATVAWPVGEGVGRSVPPKLRDYFFPSGIVVPKPGRWLLVATSGANWGCFIVNVV